jgi:hypothetical protein
MHFKNYKSSELYILPNLVHPNYLSLIYILLSGIGITRTFLTSPSLSLSLRPMPDNGACADPTTIAAAAHPRSDPLADCGSSHAPRQQVPPLTFLFLFLLHAWPQHIRICAANRAKQSTHRDNIHFYHLPRK